MIEFPLILCIRSRKDMIDNRFPSIFIDAPVSKYLIILHMFPAFRFPVRKSICKTDACKILLCNAFDALWFCDPDHLQDSRRDIRYMMILSPYAAIVFDLLWIGYDQWIFDPTFMCPDLIPLEWCISCICPAGRIMV